MFESTELLGKTTFWDLWKKYGKMCRTIKGITLEPLGVTPLK